MRNVVWMFGAFALMGCPSDKDGSTDEVFECDGYATASECDADAACFAVTGTDQCGDGDEVFADCFDAVEDCPASISYLRPAGDAGCYEFSGCAPEGWEACDPSECDGEVDCAAITTESECLAQTECRAELGDPDTCDDDISTVFGGCVDAEQDCDDSIKYADPGDGSCWEFGGCVPEGWTECEPECPFEDLCMDLDPEDCGLRADCVVIGGQDACDDTGLPLELGCMDASMGCGDAETYAHPPGDDTCYYFSDTCIPDGWVECEPECGDSCVGLDEAACEGALDCYPTFGEDLCAATAPAFQGCIDDVGCGDLPTNAAPPGSSTCFQFYDTCVPDGWVTCDPGICDPVTTCGPSFEVSVEYGGVKVTSANAGDPVTLIGEVRNDCPDPITVEFGSSCYVNSFNMSSSTGVGEGTAFACLTVITSVDLNPGESVTQEEGWTVGGAGTWTIQANFGDLGVSSTASTTLNVAP